VSGIFKANNPSGNLFLFVYAVILKLPAFLFYSKPHLQKFDGIFYKSFLQLISPIASSFSPIFSIISFLLLYFQAITLNKIVQNQKLLKHNNYLAGMAYLLITSLFPEWFSLSAPLVINTLMIWILKQLCELPSTSNPKTVIFNIGLTLGLASFIYFPSITFIILVIIAMAISRAFKLQEWFIALLGLITPMYFYLAYLFLFGNFNTYQFPGFHLSLPLFFNNKLYYACLIFLIAVLTIGIYFVNQNFNRQVIQSRKTWQLIFLYFLVASLMSFINAGINFTYWILLAIPATPIIAAAFFYPQKKYVGMVLHLIFFALYIAQCFLSKYN
jgi:hypothetical protein